MQSSSPTFRDFYDLIVESEQWTPEQIRDHQRERLAELLHHACRHVPFYASRLDAVVGSNGDINWDRWGELPIVTRRDLYDHRDAMQATELPPGHGPTSTISSSGSTGIPITVTNTSIASRLWQALRWRLQERHGFDWSAWIVTRLGNIEGPVDWPQGTPIGPWGPPWDPASRRGFSWSINLKAPPSGVLDFLERRPCRYLVAGPKTAHLMALETRRSGRKVALEKILIQSGKLGDEDRAICKEVFGADMVDAYSSKEGGQMAYRCGHGQLHVNPQNLLIEIIRADGSRASPGETGRVVITPFYSTAQPLIRYDQGDLASFGGPCGCGLHWPALAEIAGRTLAIFVHPDGRNVLANLPGSARDLLNCSLWQVAQTGPTDFEIRYVERETPGPRDEAAFIAVFRSLFFDDANVRITRLDEIPLTRGGKLNEYVREWQGS